MLPLLPPSLRKMKRVLDCTELKTAIRSANVTQMLYEAFARVSQEALASRMRLWDEKMRQANGLRKFVFELIGLSDRKRLFGFSNDEIEKWEVATKRDATRRRVKRLRDRRKKAHM
jgi:hypothetical protein